MYFCSEFMLQMIEIEGCFKGSKWAIWKIEESESELLEMLTKQHLYEEIKKRISKKRRIEMLAVRVLLKEILGEEKSILYTASGKPYFEDKTMRLGISHTKNHVAVALDHSEDVGIDIEHEKDRLLKLKSKYILDTDFVNATVEKRHLSLYWCAKESAYKLINNPEIDLLQEIKIEAFTPRERIGTFTLNYLQNNNIEYFDALYYCTDNYSFTLLKRSQPHRNSASKEMLSYTST